MFRSLGRAAFFSAIRFIVQPADADCLITLKGYAPVIKGKKPIKKTRCPKKEAAPMFLPLLGFVGEILLRVHEINESGNQY